MYRIRFHGRGGQGMKTASRILGTAFFLQGYEVQDAPRYGAERRGAPVFAFVRADHAPINERGVIRHPGLVIVADESLVPIPAAGVLAGITEQSLLLINSNEKEAVWQHRLNLVCPIIILPVTSETVERADLPYIGAACAGAAARLSGVITDQVLEQAIREELSQLGTEIIEKNLHNALAAYEAMAASQGMLRQGSMASAEDYTPPDWLELSFENARISAPSIHAPATSIRVKTGLWRTQRPIIDYAHCNHCWWICSSYCPDAAINVEEGNRPVIDYDHCKGCLICVAQCPPHAIEAVPERVAQAREAETPQGKPK